MNEYKSHRISVVRMLGGILGFDIYRSPSGMPAIQAGSPSATTWPGSMENVHETFKRYNKQKPF
jgi:hypothetical protein